MQGFPQPLELLNPGRTTIKPTTLPTNSLTLTDLPLLLAILATVRLDKRAANVASVPAIGVLNNNAEDLEVQVGMSVWQPYYRTPLTCEDALEMIMNVGRLFDVLYGVKS